MSCSEWRIISFEESGLEIEDGDRGKNYPKKSELLPTGYCPFLNNKNVINDKITLDDVEFITKEKDEILRKGKIKVNDIVLTTRGSVGNVGLFHSGLRYKHARINSGMVIIRNNNDIFNLKYLYQLLKSPLMKNQYKSMSTGTAQPQLPIKDIKKLELIVPPLEEQEKIANILSSLDDKIELNNDMNKTLEEMAQSIFKRWFVDFEFPNEDGEPYKSSGGEMVDSELGMIPKGWKVDNLGSLIKIQNGYAFKSKDLKDEGDCRVIKIKNINDLKVDINNTQYIEVDLSKKIDKKYHLKSNDIIIAMTGAEVGKIGILPQTENILYLNQRVGKFVENKLGGKYYALCMLSSTDGQSLLKNKAMGSAQPNISSSAIEEFRIVLPKEDILNQFYKITNTMYEKISRNNGNNITLNILRDTILPKLMSCEISLNE